MLKELPKDMQENFAKVMEKSTGMLLEQLNEVTVKMYKLLTEHFGEKLANDIKILEHNYHNFTYRDRVYVVHFLENTPEYIFEPDCSDGHPIVDFVRNLKNGSYAVEKTEDFIKNTILKEFEYENGIQDFYDTYGYYTVPTLLEKYVDNHKEYFDIRLFGDMHEYVLIDK